MRRRPRVNHNVMLRKTFFGRRGGDAVMRDQPGPPLVQHDHTGDRRQHGPEIGLPVEGADHHAQLCLRLAGAGSGPGRARQDRRRIASGTGRCPASRICSTAR